MENLFVLGAKHVRDGRTSHENCKQSLALD